MTNIAAESRISLATNGIYEYTDSPVVFGGGGRGQTATVEYNGSDVSVKATSKAQAVEDLLDAIRSLDTAQAEDPIEVDADLVTGAKPRMTDDEAISILRDRFGDFDLIDRDPTDEDQVPGPVWHGDDLVEIIPCVAECMDGRSDICECKCGGANHGLAGDLFVGALEAGGMAHALGVIRPTVHGPKPCLCGCGGITNRRFVPGHDAKYHGRIKREQQAKERGISVDEVPAALARERRARRKAAKEAAEQAAA